MGLTFKLIDSEWSRLPSIMWVGLIQSVEALRQRLRFPEEGGGGGGSTNRLPLELSAAPCCVSSLQILEVPASTIAWTNFLKSTNQPISQFSPPSLYIHYMHTFDWFCFSGEAWLIYCASPYSIFFNNQPQFISYCPLFPHQLLLWMLVLWPMMNGWSSIPTVIPAYLLCENIVLGLQGDLCGQKWHLCIEQLLCGPRRKTSEIKKCPGSYFGGQIKLKSIYNPSCVA